jgi:hypothetical protein
MLNQKQVQLLLQESLTISLSSEHPLNILYNEAESGAGCSASSSLLLIRLLLIFARLDLCQSPPPLS